MNLKTILLAFVCLTVAACEDKSAAKTPVQVEAPQAPIAPQVTPDDWKMAVEATYKKSRVED